MTEPRCGKTIGKGEEEDERKREKRDTVTESDVETENVRFPCRVLLYLVFYTEYITISSKLYLASSTISL
jgi:hypothetical protein